jgi:hypothetical protein
MVTRQSRCCSIDAKVSEAFRPPRKLLYGHSNSKYMFAPNNLEV